MEVSLGLESSSGGCRERVNSQQRYLCQLQWEACKGLKPTAQPTTTSLPVCLRVFGVLLAFMLTTTLWEFHYPDFMERRVRLRGQRNVSRKTGLELGQKHSHKRPWSTCLENTSHPHELLSRTVAGSVCMGRAFPAMSTVNILEWVFRHSVDILHLWIWKLSPSHVRSPFPQDQGAPTTTQVPTLALCMYTDMLAHSVLCFPFSVFILFQDVLIHICMCNVSVPIGQRETFDNLQSQVSESCLVVGAGVWTLILW